MDELISRQDAIEVADAVWSATGDVNVAKVWDQIKDLPSVQSNMHDLPKDADCISRQAVIDALEKVSELYPWRVPGDRDSYSSYNEAWQDALNRAENEINALPSAEPERPKEPCEFCQNHEKGDTLYESSSWDGGVGYDYVNDIKFCPICGRELQDG